MMRVGSKTGVSEGPSSSPPSDGPNRITIVPNVKPRKTFRLFHLFVCPLCAGFLFCSYFFLFYPPRFRAKFYKLQESGITKKKQKFVLNKKRGRKRT